MNFAAAGQRGVKSRYAGCSAFFHPFGQGLARPNAKSAEVKDLKLGPTPGMKSCNTLQGLKIVIKGRTDENANLQVVTAARLLPIVEAMNELLEAVERQRAALPRFRDQAIAADMSAWRVAQGKPQTPSRRSLSAFSTPGSRNRLHRISVQRTNSLARHYWGDVVHKALHRSEKLIQVAIAVEVDLERIKAGLFTVVQ